MCKRKSARARLFFRKTIYNQRKRSRPGVRPIPVFFSVGKFFRKNKVQRTNLIVLNSAICFVKEQAHFFQSSSLGYCSRKIPFACWLLLVAGFWFFGLLVDNPLRGHCGGNSFPKKVACFMRSIYLSTATQLARRRSASHLMPHGTTILDWVAPRP